MARVYAQGYHGLKKYYGAVGMTKKSVGIYINKTTLQFVILSKGFKKAKLVAAESIRIPEGESVISSAVSVKPIELRVKGSAAPVKEQKILTGFESTVKDLLKQYGIKEGQVIATALPPESMVIRYFQMPRVPQQEHKTAVVFEARKYLPYKLEDVIYAYSISYDKVASNKMAVTFVAAEKNSVAACVRFYENLGLKIGYLEAIPYSLMRFLYQTKDTEPDQTAALIHIGQESANIDLVRNKVLYLTRNVSFSGKLGQPLNIQTAGQSPEELENALTGLRFDNLFSEVRLSFDYFHRQFPEEKIEKMIFWSDERKMQENVQAAGKDLNVYAKIANPFDSIEKGAGYSVEYAIGAGLALKSLYEPNAGINLSPGFKKIEIEKLAKLILKELCVAIALLFVFSIVDGRKIKALDAELDNILGQRSALQMQAGNMSRAVIEERKQQAQEKFNYLQNLATSKISVLSKINRVGNLLPEGMWLSELGYGKIRGRSSLILKGYAFRLKGDNQIKIISQLVEGLKSDGVFSKGFTDIKLDSILNERYAGMPVTSFQISCSME